MKRKTFTSQQIAKILKEFEEGKIAAEISREHGVSQAAFYGSLHFTGSYKLLLR